MAINPVDAQWEYEYSIADSETKIAMLRKKIEGMEAVAAIHVAALYEVRNLYINDERIGKVTGQALCYGRSYDQQGFGRLVERQRELAKRYHRALAWLNKHGQHAPPCSIRNQDDAWTKDCTCGLDAIQFEYPDDSHKRI